MDLNSVFTQIRDNLDAHYDRRERLVKFSRDITALSKKMIFSLQRVQGEIDALPQGIQKEVDTREGEIEPESCSRASSLTRWLKELFPPKCWPSQGQ
jgi:predicted translin family RNA/ssDNA-binding protein